MDRDDIFDQWIQWAEGLEEPAEPQFHPSHWEGWKHDVLPVLAEDLWIPESEGVSPKRIVVPDLLRSDLREILPVIFKARLPVVVLSQFHDAPRSRLSEEERRENDVWRSQMDRLRMVHPPVEVKGFNPRPHCEEGDVLLVASREAAFFAFNNRAFPVWFVTSEIHPTAGPRPGCTKVRVFAP